MPKSSARSKTSIRYTKNPRTPVSLLIAVLVILVACVGTLGILLAKATNWQSFTDAKGQFQVAQPVEISGTLLFTALKPDPTDKGEIHLVAKQEDIPTWVDTEVKIPLKQDAPWSWNQALPGVNYELQAILTIDGKVTKKSEVVHVTGPAAQVELPLEVNWRDLPKDVVTTRKTNLGGDITVNGYIPDSSVLEIYSLSAKNSQNEFAQVTPELLQTATKIGSISKPTPTTHWTWPQAVPLEQYVIVSVLKDKNKIIGIADEILRADAGQEKLEQTINSEAIPTQTSTTKTSVLGATTGGISGTVFLQGPKQKDTSLLVLWRNPGDKDFNVVNRYMYPPSAGTAWQWSDAQVGKRYDITAALQVDNNNTSTLQVPLSVTAPATNVNMTLNTWYVIPQTNQKPVNEVCVDNNGNQSTAIIRLPAMANAQQYWILVGSNAGGNDVYNQKVPASDQDVKVRVRVKNGQMNYMRYSYATCEHCSNNSNFAPFSPEVGFVCS